MKILFLILNCYAIINFILILTCQNYRIFGLCYAMFHILFNFVIFTTILNYKIMKNYFKEKSLTK